MANHREAFRHRLARVRRQWKAATAFDGAILVATETLGLFLLFLLADAIYDFSGHVRLGLLIGGASLLAVLSVRHVVRPLVRRIPDEQIALYIEERSPAAEGSVISALECQRQRRDGLSGFIASLLVDDAVRRIDRTGVRMYASLRRLRKHVLIACGLVAAFAVTSLSFPKYTRHQARRIIAPWVSIRQERQEAERREHTRLAELRRRNKPIEIDLQPRGMTILRGRGIEFVATVSREPAEPPVFRYRYGGPNTGEQPVEMTKAQARLSYLLPFRDINESFTYRVTAGKQSSESYEIKVHDPLAVRGIELTYHYPEYLRRDAEHRSGPNGDVTALTGTRVDVRVLANNPLTAGALKFDDGRTVTLKPGPQPADGATGSFTVQKDGSYSYEVTDVYGETRRSEDFYFVKTVPDEPPTVAMVSPKVDMSVHPLCELTFAAKVADDFGLRDATVHATYFRDGKPVPMPLALTPAGQDDDFRNFLEGRAEHILELEKVTPKPKVGDMIFYYLEVTDRKGQSVRTDLFFVKLMPFEVAAAWPAEVSPPDLPHWDYLWTPDIILIAAAAWHIEQQRGKIPVGEFQAQCTQLAGRMEPAMNSQNGLSLLGGKQKLPKHILASAADVLAAAQGKLDTALGLLKGYEPGKAALEMQQAMALAESVNVEKAFQETEMAQTPIHTGQPSGGYNQDAVMEQAEFRLPGVMSDSLTAFQQEDNPRHFLPPDFRRTLRLKERTAPLSKELRLAGEIYASQEQLLEMAREQFGHRKLREAAEMSCTNDPAAGSGTKARMIRVDKRAVPWASMDPNAPLPPSGNRGQMSQPKSEKIRGLKYASPGDNSRAGPGSPHRSQTPGGGASEEDEPDRRTKDRRRDSLYDEQWKVQANDRRPRSSQGGGGGGDSQPQRSQPGMETMQQPSGGGSASQSGAGQQLAAQQAALAQRAAQLARGLSRDIKPSDAMGRRAADGVREASREMRRAASSFQRGDLSTGIVQARRAQQAMRTAMRGMRAAQYGTLGEALAAAQQGAAALTQNQYRVSQGTRHLAERIGELAGEQAPATAGTPQTAQGQPGQAQPGQGQPGKTQPGQGPSGKAQPGKTQPGEARPGKPQTRPGVGRPGEGESDKGRGGTAQPVQGQGGSGRPGEGGAVAGVSPAAVEKAKARDPRIAAQMKHLAGEQLALSESLKGFEGYVHDLIEWSKEVEKDRVATSLQDVTGGLKQADVAQKMVDAGVDLSQDDLASAQATQRDIEAALDRMDSRLREAGDILAGSKAGILSRASRQAKEVATRVRQIAGLPQRGGMSGKPSPGGAAQPGSRQPGQGRPGEGQPAPSQSGSPSPGGGPSDPDGAGQTQDSLAERLAAEQRRRMGLPSSPGRPGAGQNVPGGAGRADEEIDDLWLTARDLTRTLRQEELVDGTTLEYIERRVQDPKRFREMFDKVRKAEAGKFSDVVTGVGRSLDEILEETLSARKLHAERREECPAKFRSFVDAYFEALSKAATRRPRP
jgi:hypothetical protein